MFFFYLMTSIRMIALADVFIYKKIVFAGAINCPYGFIGHDTSCYFFSHNGVTMTTANVSRDLEK